MAEDRDLRAEFAAKGYAHLKSLVDPVSCEKLIFRMRDLVAHRCVGEKNNFFRAGEEQQSCDDFFLNSAKNISFFWDPNAHKAKKNDNPFFLLNKVGHALHHRCPVFGKFSHQQRFYQIVRMLGQQSPLLVQSMFIFKQSGFGDAVPAHQDATFLYTEPNSVIGLWFALEDANEDNGCLWVLEGGHVGPLKTRFIKGGKSTCFSAAKRVHWPKNSFKPVPAKKGDVIVLHGMLPHFSEENRSSKTRYAYTLHFIDGKAYFPKSNWLK
ncbi:MAG: phytanoyl-CoA dioxygenase family protein [Myxococcales bacterium]|nr:phytanoyl-CoA dioxygenase family protein [Myxococcales bacterium]USN51587.1 MAG: phytanoyl-CoA dioxygenase family protein [Myxococcales bacterium]